MAQLLTTGRAAEVLGVNRLTVHNRIARGELPAAKMDGVAGRWQFVLDAADVERHLQERGYGASRRASAERGPKRLSDVKSS